MYLPKHYAVTDRSRIFEFMKSNSFGILFSHTDITLRARGQPSAIHPR